MADRTPLVDIDDVELTLRDYIPPDPKTSAFRYWHVEALINQAADLLERVLSDVREYDNIRVQWFNVANDFWLAENRLALEEERWASGLATAGTTILGEERKRRLLIYPYYRRILELSRAQLAASSTSLPYKMAVAAASADYRKAVMELQLTKFAWDNSAADDEHKKKRFEFDKDALKRKKDAMTFDYGVLNFPERARRLLKRLEEDWKSSVDRISVAQLGMSKIYGYPEQGFIQEYFSDNDSVVNASLLWIRDAIRWLSAFSQLDQGIALVIPVHEVILDQEWEQIRNTAQQEEKRSIQFYFRPNFDRLTEYSYVRCRGISAFVVSTGSASAPWSIDLQLPEKAYTTHHPSPEPKELDQTELPGCYLGRIEGRNISRPPDLAGVVSLMNACPVGVDGDKGRWQATVSCDATSEVPRWSSLSGIELELNLAVRRLPQETTNIGTRK